MIYVTGDTHIPFDISKLNTKHFPVQKELGKDDYVIICGDFGGVWNNDKEEQYWRRWLDNKNFTTLFVDGNHENFDLLDAYETIDILGGKAHKISESIYHLMRGQVYTIGGKRIFTFGGAGSHDKEIRKEGVSWWRQEMPSPEEMNTAAANLENLGWSVDYIVTHCAPTSVQRSLSADFESDILTDFLEEIKTKTNFCKWYFGHYHIDKIVEDKFVCLFYDIIEL